MGSTDQQQFLDNNQYHMTSILRYEKMFGYTFVSTGGKETTTEFLQLLDLKSGDYVLDVGCGIGGSAFMMEKEYGARVRGIDLSKNMLQIAQQRKQELNSENTSFHYEDASAAEYEENEFDVIYSRDTILHIPDKESLYRKFIKWLKPGGRLFVTDYSCRKEDQTPEFVEYVKQRGYSLLPPDEYSDVITSAGFTAVVVRDLKDYFLDILQRELKRFKSSKEEFLNDNLLTEKDYLDLIRGWERKIARVTEGSQKWVSISAKKAA